MMITHFPVLIVAFPLIMSFVTFMVGIFYRPGAYYLAVMTLGACVIMAASLFLQVFWTDEIIRYAIGGWPPPWGIEYTIDHLNSLMLSAISVIGFLVVIHSRRAVANDIHSDKIHIFYALILLQMTGLLGMTATADIFNLYVLLEIASFSAYGLIAVGRRGAEFASFRYMIFGTIGACAYLLGVGYVYILTGSLNMSDLSTLLPNLYGSRTLMTGFLFIMLGMAIKMALFPLHIWMPDAYSLAPLPVSSLLAPLFTKVSAYVLIRISFTVFQPMYATHIHPAFYLLGWTAGLGILFAGFMAIAQSDTRRMLCYVIVAEVGYIILGLVTANKFGFMGAMLHTLNDMFMMACLFAALTSLSRQLKSLKIGDWQGVSKYSPIPLAVFMLGGLSVIGIPPFCGFFSKWYLLLGLIEAKYWMWALVLLASSLMNAVCFFRITENVYLSGPGNSHPINNKALSWPEGSVLVILSLFLVFLGLMSGYLIEFIGKYVVMVRL